MRTRFLWLSVASAALLTAYIGKVTVTTYKRAERARLNFDLSQAVDTSNDRAVVNLLNAGVEPNARQRLDTPATGWRAILDAVRGRKPPPARYGLPLLLVAEWQDDEPAALALIQHGANPNTSCVVHNFGGCRASALALATIRGQPRIVHALLQRGADPNCPLDVGIPGPVPSVLYMARFSASWASEGGRYPATLRRYEEVIALLKAAGAKE